MLEAPYDAPSRFEDDSNTNPEELIGAANAGCFSMALANELSDDGYVVESIETDATVELDPRGPELTSVLLETSGRVLDIEEETFTKYARDPKEVCPVSRALAVDVTVDTTLEA